MNFLAHYFTDQKPENHYFNLGLILPDLARGHLKVNAFLHTDSDLPFHQEIIDGCIKHISSDKKFHASSFFEHYLSLVSTSINSAGFSEALQRKWFLAHILFELLIDRVILKRDKEPVDRFYNDLNKVDENILASLLNQLNAQSVDSFMQRFNHFRQVQYIRYYDDNNKLIYSLNRIMMRAGLAEMTGSDSALLLKVLDELENTNFAAHEKLLVELHQVFIAE